MGRTDNAKRNLIWGFIQKIVSVLIPFVSRTIIMLHHMHNEAGIIHLRLLY